ncbi:PH domain-containing protein [Niallia circulans]
MVYTYLFSRRGSATYKVWGFYKVASSNPLYKIQNIHRHTSVFHKGLHLTSLTLETGETGDSSSIPLTVIRKKEADWLESYIHQPENVSAGDGEEAKTVAGSERTVHFQVTRRDLVKASFSSLSFLALIPLLISFSPI